MKRLHFPGVIPATVKVSLETGFAARLFASAQDVPAPVVPGPYLVGRRIG